MRCLTNFVDNGGICMSIEILEFEEMKYVIRYPDKYEEGKKYPVIIFLHGAGTRGNDINVLLNGLYFQLAYKHSDFQFITVAPLCSENTWFDVFEKLKRFAYKITDEKFTDKERVYLVGASMGGYCTWQLAMSLPELFAAIVPICGGGMYWNAARIKNVPVWAFHGAKDDVVKVEESIKMVDAVNENDGSAKLTIYPENGHNAWSDTYSNYDVFKWLFNNKNTNTKTGTDIFNDSEIYG